MSKDVVFMGEGSFVNKDENQLIQYVEVEGNEVKIWCNKRKGPGEFEALFHCMLCDPHCEKFMPKLMQIPKSGVMVCKHCLSKLIEAMNEAALYDCKEEGR